MKINLPNQVNKALQIIHHSGYEAYVVGGCVRDALIGIPTHDYDITTNAKPSIIMEIFMNYNIIETGLKHGTVTVIIQHMPIEITTYRIDGPYIDNRHPDEIVFAHELKEDLQRRDFTMNAIAFNEDHGIIDLFHGKEDIENGVIRCVGDPNDRFGEDALRIIRALRFSSTLNFGIEEKASNSIHKNKELLKKISIERITIEFSKMICGKHVGKILSSFSDVIQIIIPELAQVHMQQDMSDSHHDYLQRINIIVNTPPILHMRLASLLNSSVGKSNLDKLHASEANAKIARKILHDMRYDKVTSQKVYTLVLYNNVEIKLDEKHVKRWMNKLTPQVLKEVLQLKKINELAKETDDICEIVEIDQMITMMGKILSEKSCYSIKCLAIKGDDLLKLGVPPSKRVGELLVKLLDEVIDGNVDNEKEKLTNLARGYVKRVE